MNAPKEPTRAASGLPAVGIAAGQWVLAKPDAPPEQIPLGLKTSSTICLAVGRDQKKPDILWAVVFAGGERVLVRAEHLMPDPARPGQHAYPDGGLTEDLLRRERHTTGEQS